ncbi:MAG: hypothetical protein EXR74_09550 [Bdellovibrionales bacterium]|nr:hypothetical protein [Bdellovibrionales bacterium]
MKTEGYGAILKLGALCCYLLGRSLMAIAEGEAIGKIAELDIVEKAAGIEFKKGTQIETGDYLFVIPSNSKSILQSRVCTLQVSETPKTNPNLAEFTEHVVVIADLTFCKQTQDLKVGRMVKLATLPSVFAAYPVITPSVNVAAQKVSNDIYLDTIEEVAKPDRQVTSVSQDNIIRDEEKKDSRYYKTGFIGPTLSIGVPVAKGVTESDAITGIGAVLGLHLVQGYLGAITFIVSGGYGDKTYSSGLATSSMSVGAGMLIKIPFGFYGGGMAGISKVKLKLLGQESKGSVGVLSAIGGIDFPFGSYISMSPYGTLSYHPSYTLQEGSYNGIVVAGGLSAGVGLNLRVNF